MLTMKKNGILKKFLYRGQKACGARIFLQIGFKKFLDISKQMNQAFLFGECSDFVSVSVPEVGNKHPVVKFSQMIYNNLGSPAFVDVKESDEGISKHPEPIALPSGLVSMHERIAFQRIINGVIELLPLPGYMFIEVDHGGRRHGQISKTLQSQSGIVVRIFVRRFRCFMAAIISLDMRPESWSESKK